MTKSACKFCGFYFNNVNLEKDDCPQCSQKYKMECHRCSKGILICECEHPSPNPVKWPENWRELHDKMPKCDRCKTTLAPKLYVLCEQYPEITVCRLCSNAYHKHMKVFVDEIKKD